MDLIRGKNMNDIDIEDDDMHIERVSKYKPISTPSRSHEGSTVRQMLISIPKLKWLDDDRENCRYYNEYKPIEEAKPKTPNDINRSPSWCARLKGQPLSPQEERVYQLRSSMQPTAIGRTLGLKVSTVRGMMARIRAKKGEL